LEPIARQLIAWLSDYRSGQGDIRGTAISAMLFHHLWPQPVSGAPFPKGSLLWLNIALKLFSEEKDFAAVTDLGWVLDARIETLKAEGPDVKLFGG
jgi:hypothetical protein